MGKLKRQRQKLHITSKNDQSQSNESCSSLDVAPLLPITPPKENVFAGLNIDFGTINSLPDDLQSVKSYKSLKSEIGSQKIVPKKEKIKLRRELLLQKIDSVNQMKKQLKLRVKRKHVAIMGDTNPLHDALPSLESLLKSKPTKIQDIKCKGIDKANQRKKKLVQNINVFKRTLKNNTFKKNPFEVITSHIKHVVEQERGLIKK